MSAIFENNTSGRARFWDTALKFLCPGLSITSPDHLERVLEILYHVTQLARAFENHRGEGPGDEVRYLTQICITRTKFVKCLENYHYKGVN